MIVLDENLQVLRLDNPIAAWYPGRVCYIIDLRSGMVIKDEAISGVLLREKGATFVTQMSVTSGDVYQLTRAMALFACLSRTSVYLQSLICCGGFFACRN